MHIKKSDMIVHISQVCIYPTGQAHDLNSVLYE